jgi:hypothetical protein
MNAAPVPSSSNEIGSGVCATACTVGEPSPAVPYDFTHALSSASPNAA